MNISEIFFSIQGEGIRLGVPSIFIRTSGCNLRCKWCDTPYTSWKPEKNNMGIPEILEELKKVSKASKKRPEIVITGGEPFIQPELSNLVSALKERNYRITIETSGTKYCHVEADLFSISPKLKNSVPEHKKWTVIHEKERINFEVLKKFYLKCENNPDIDFQLKFVVQRKSDMKEIETLIENLEGIVNTIIPPEKILIMPEGRTMKETHSRYLELVDICLEYGYRLTPRLHIDIWGDRRGV